jgi:hypothetical protein
VVTLIICLVALCVVLLVLRVAGGSGGGRIPLGVATIRFGRHAQQLPVRQLAPEAPSADGTVVRLALESERDGESVKMTPAEARELAEKILASAAQAERRR